MKTRTHWVQRADQLVTPVLRNLAEGKLRATMPRERYPDITDEEVGGFPYLEAFARALCGIAPFLEAGGAHPEEQAVASRLREWTHAGLQNLCDPRSPDYGEFRRPFQPVVDGAFLALAFLRAPRALWEELPERTQGLVLDAFSSLRGIRPHANNWLLFGAAIDAFLAVAGEDWDPMRIDYALRIHLDHYYAGDGVYGDGPAYHHDYYNSIVIHPFLTAILDAVGDHFPDWQEYRQRQAQRALRFAAIQERTILADGTYPPCGRSLTYRGGVFHHLAEAAFREKLPDDVSAGQVRCALDAMIGKTLDPPGTFDDDGWLRIGVAGAQPGLGERYIKTGSLYLASTPFLPLGLPPEAPFWSEPDKPWTAVRFWKGENLPADHALHD